MQQLIPRGGVSARMSHLFPHSGRVPATIAPQADTPDPPHPSPARIGRRIFGPFSQGHRRRAGPQATRFNLEKAIALAQEAHRQKKMI